MSHCKFLQTSNANPPSLKWSHSFFPSKKCLAFCDWPSMDPKKCHKKTAFRQALVYRHGVAPHRPDPPCGKPTWNLWIFLPGSLRQSAEFMGKNASIVCNQQTENMVKIPSSVLWRSWFLKNCCTCRRRQFWQCSLSTVARLLVSPVASFLIHTSCRENNRKRKCFTLWFAFIYQMICFQPSKPKLVDSDGFEKKKTVVSRNLLFTGWALWTKKLLWSEALSLLILWLITRYHDKSGIRIRTYFTPPIPETFHRDCLSYLPLG